MVDAEDAALGPSASRHFRSVSMAMIYAVGQFGYALQRGSDLCFAHSALHMPSAVVYWVAQFVGATSATHLLRAALGNIAHVRDPAFRLSDAVVALRVVMTAFLMSEDLAVPTDTRAVGEAAAIAIGAPSVSTRSAHDLRRHEPDAITRPRARLRNLHALLASSNGHPGSVRRRARLPVRRAEAARTCMGRPTSQKLAIRARGRRGPRRSRLSGRWAVTGSNRRPPGCKPGALPAELTAPPER